MDRRLNTAYWVLRIGLGVGPFVAGLDKFFNFLADWTMYLSPLATKVVPISPGMFMHIVGVVEMIVGVAVVAGFTRIGAWVLMLWLFGIAGNLVTTGMYYDLAVRDVEIALGAFALASLAAVRESSGVSQTGS